jgi:hypothetical protein
MLSRSGSALNADLTVAVERGGGRGAMPYSSYSLAGGFTAMPVSYVTYESRDFHHTATVDYAQIDAISR